MNVRRPARVRCWAVLRSRTLREAERAVADEDREHMLRDHDGRPNSVCRHPDEAYPPDDRYETVVSVVMDLDAKELRRAAGNPRATPYERATIRE